MVLLGAVVADNRVLLAQECMSSPPSAATKAVPLTSSELFQLDVATGEWHRVTATSHKRLIVVTHFARAQSLNSVLRLSLVGLKRKRNVGKVTEKLVKVRIKWVVNVCERLVQKL